jgi:3-hydroxyisobutyrate dehydrogenase-like beta-hydroxyacid dehydrogenase
MGAAMAARLRAQGVEVSIFNRTSTRAEEIAASTGATVAASAREAAAADVVLVSLADDAACLATYAGPDGLAVGVTAGTVVVDASTISPETARQLGESVRAHGGAFLDAPVSGSVPLVEKGELTVMAGGAADDVQRARPVLEHLATRIVLVGGPGAGATMKLAVNAIVHALNLALAEALVLAEAAGIDRSTAYDVFAGSAAGAPFVQYKRAAFEKPDQTPVAFSLDLVAKDLDLILRLASQVGVPLSQAATNREVVETAIAAGLGQRDMSMLAQLLRNATDATR